MSISYADQPRTAGPDEPGTSRRGAAAGCRTRTEFLGTITFTNGIWSGNADFGFHMQSNSTDPLLDGHIFDTIVRMRLTSPNLPTNTPQQNADFLELIDMNTGLMLVNPLTGLPLPTIRVYELADSPDGHNTGDVLLFEKSSFVRATTLSNPFKVYSWTRRTAHARRSEHGAGAVEHALLAGVL
jgi:hypothetical protein